MNTEEEREKRGRVVYPPGVCVSNVKWKAIDLTVASETLMYKAASSDEVLLRSTTRIGETLASAVISSDLYDIVHVPVRVEYVPSSSIRVDLWDEGRIWKEEEDNAGKREEHGAVEEQEVPSPSGER